ncbi:hypothetical protein PYW08_014370 [Mythimna loreyi]|uniref:Uncharacterized protein n=1 Tax=Mythimna loreyi TaxID=667449 RepID=A0ACC2R772_9NEOP|nr:hypothetical protein PYW08_014370 [Mythimna loreyi]
MAARAERFWSGDRVPEDVVLVGLPQGGPTTWSRLLEFDGCETHGTGRCGDVWGRPMSSSGRLSAELMMMIDDSKTFDRFLIKLVIQHNFTNTEGLKKKKLPTLIQDKTTQCEGYSTNET